MAARRDLMLHGTLPERTSMPKASTPTNNGIAAWRMFRGRQ